MADLIEVEQALNILTTAGTIRSKITVLQCTTQYPTPFENANLLAMVDMRERLGVQVGYSDHTLGIEASIAAVAMGAQVIEKHFTLDKGLTGPDHSASIEPPELGMLVKSIKNVEMALGQSEKKPTGEEILMRNVARRSIVAGKCIAEGEMLTEENLQIKRPGDGIPPGDLDRIIGTLAIRAFSTDEKIEV
jgi:N,N'-diacetyllegionaminate synthase